MATLTDTVSKMQLDLCSKAHTRIANISSFVTVTSYCYLLASVSSSKQFSAKPVLPDTIHGSSGHVFNFFTSQWRNP